MRAHDPRPQRGQAAQLSFDRPGQLIGIAADSPAEHEQAWVEHRGDRGDDMREPHPLQLDRLARGGITGPGQSEDILGTAGGAQAEPAGCPDHAVTAHGPLHQALAALHAAAPGVVGSAGGRRMPGLLQPGTCGANWNRRGSRSGTPGAPR